VLLHRAELALAEADRLTDTVAQIQQLETVADRISTATGQWQTAQDHSSRVVTAAREIADRMDRETRDFLTFFDKADTTEKNHLRLENEKLRRAEADWLQVLVRILDHIFALQQAAARSAQPNVANQITAFQNACRDAARRIGLVPVTVNPGTPFDPKAHQAIDPNAAVPEWPVIAQVVGPGYSFQGQALRPVVVALKAGAPPAGSVSGSLAAPAVVNPSGTTEAQPTGVSALETPAIANPATTPGEPAAASEQPKEQGTAR
jgi:molecular chaperone GrpE (heat shock protein)